MPVKRIANINTTSSWALWEITETREELIKLANLSEKDIEMVAAIKHNHKQLEWLAGRLTIRHLAERYGIKYAGMKKDEFGKPSLINSEAEISLSHSYPYVAAIISSEYPVGIDLEQPRGQLLRIANKFLSKTEKEDAENDLNKLCVYWSAKEALYKIYAKKKLIFNEDIAIEPFKFEETGSVTGKVKKNGFSQTYQLQYLKEDGFILIYNYLPGQISDG